MSKTLNFVTALLLVSCTAFSQDTLTIADTSWKTGGIVTATFNQVTLSNWAAGGANTVSLSSIGSFFAKYKKGKISWDNTLDVGYGVIKQGGEEIRKNDDKIELNSKLGRQFSKDWYYTFLLNAKTQFAPGYSYPDDTTVFKISDFAAPAYVLLSLGLDYKPVDYFSAFISPLTAKFTIVNDQDLADAGAFGVEPAIFDPLTGQLTSHGEKFRSEFGAYLNARFQKDIITNVNVMTKVDLFSNYAENPQNIDVNWEFLLTLKVNRLIVVTFGTQLIYDDDIDIADGTSVGPRTQFKQTFGAGLSYKF